MSEDQQPRTQTRDPAREREQVEYGLTEAQYERWCELLAMPTAHWPAALQARVRVALEREGQRRDAVL
jgi:hypothetical protein